MSSALSAALDTLFADPNIARDAIWRVAGAGSGVAIRAVVRRPEAISAFGDTRLVTPVALVDLRVSEAPTIAPTIAAGDTIEIDGDILLVQGEPVRDAERLIWTVEGRSP